MTTPQWLRSFAREAYDLISFFVFVLGIMLFVRFFIFNPFTVIGSSMKNTIHDGDLLIINKRDNYINNYHRGDVLVFVPEGKTDAFIKRIV
ncbi:MAG: signal peptidase I [Candidatus Peribacteria bacterium]|nr:MAG: signal peptidase I [Candidatus Peribacteria bacterium]